MREDTPKPDDWIEIETTRFTIDTGTSPKPRPKRRHPLLSLFKKGDNSHCQHRCHHHERHCGQRCLQLNLRHRRRGLSVQGARDLRPKLQARKRQHSDAGRHSRYN